MKIVKAVSGALVICWSLTALAVSELELECRIDNRLMSSVPRTITLRDGYIEEVDCQNHPTCRKSIYKITMNYNSAYESVTVAVTDLETDKALSANLVLHPNLSGDRLKNALLDVGYGDVIRSADEVAKKDSAGRFLRISCERMN